MRIFLAYVVHHLNFFCRIPARLQPIENNDLLTVIYIKNLYLFCLLVILHANFPLGKTARNCEIVKVSEFDLESSSKVCGKCMCIYK